VGGTPSCGGRRQRAAAVKSDVSHGHLAHESRPRGGEALGVREANGGWAELPDALLCVFLDGDEFEEVEDAEAAAHPRLTAGGQRVIRAGNVVAEWLRGPAPMKTEPALRTQPRSATPSTVRCSGAMRLVRAEASSGCER